VSTLSLGGRIFRAVAVVLVPVQLFLSVPVRAAEERATPAIAQDRGAPPLPPKVKVNRKVPAVRPVAAYPSFSAQPGPLEIFRARVFDEPLVPVGGSGTGEENQALAEAILSYLHGGDSQDLASFEGFLRSHPRSVWCASLLTNLGVVYRRAGYFSKALAAWEEAWGRAKGESDAYGTAVADRAIGELLDLIIAEGRARRAGKESE